MTELPPLPEYVYGHECSTHERVYTADQMRAYAAEAVRVALEQAAQVCEQRAELQSLRDIHEGNDYAAERAIEAKGCAAAIRALKGTP